MPFPTGLPTTRVHLTVTNPAGGGPATGTVRLSPNVPAIVIDGTAATFTGSGTYRLDTQGRLVDTDGTTLGVLLLDNTAPGTSPAGWLWHAIVTTDGSSPRAFYFSLEGTPDEVDLDHLQELDPEVPHYVRVPGPQGPAGPTGATGATGATGPQPPLGAAGTGPDTALRSDDPTTTNPRTPTGHAASHGENSSDPIQVAISQVPGLAEALAALLPLTGGTLTGTLVIRNGQLILVSDGTAINAAYRGTLENYAGYVLGTDQVDRWAWQMLPGSSDLILTDSANGKEIIRVTPGTNPILNFVRDVLVRGANLTVQREDGEGAFRMRVTGGGLDYEIGGMDVTVSVWENPDFSGTQHDVMRWEQAGPHCIGRTQFGTTPYDTVHEINATTGIAGLGAKNGLVNVRLAGFKVTAGAPTTGDWAAGDVVLDSAGAWHLCTVAGQPGTWT